MAERARESALEFTSARMAENYFTAYEELLLDAQVKEAQEKFAQCA